LEVVLLETRACRWAAAAHAAAAALRVHSGTGRLWAALVQLRARPAAWDLRLASDHAHAHQRLQRAVAAAHPDGSVAPAQAASASADAAAAHPEGPVAAAPRFGLSEEPPSAALGRPGGSTAKRRRAGAALRRRWSGAGGLPLSLAAPYAVPPTALAGAASAFDALRRPDVATDARGTAAEGANSEAAAAGAAPAGDGAGPSSVPYAPFGASAWDYTWAQQATLAAALAEVPKSGEVWCEGARCCLDPLGRAFDPAAAER